MIENEPPKPMGQKPTSSVIENSKEQDIEFDTIQRQSMENSKYELLSGYLDGELTQQEAQKVILLLENDSEYRQLHDEMAAMRQEVQSLSLQESELEHLDKLFKEPVAKTSRIFGFALASVSAFVLVLLTMYAVIINEAISLWLKFAIGFLAFGGLLLLCSVLRQRLINSKKDKYNRVKI